SIVSVPKTVTIPGCDSAAVAWTSRSNRARAPESAKIPAPSRLIAIGRCVPGWMALKTVPCDPRPISPTTVYGPSLPGSAAPVASRTIENQSSSARSNPNLDRRASSASSSASRSQSRVLIDRVLRSDLLGDQFFHPRLDTLAHLVDRLLAHAELG